MTTAADKAAADKAAADKAAADKAAADKAAADKAAADIQKIKDDARAELLAEQAEEAKVKEAELQANAQADITEMTSQKEAMVTGGNLLLRIAKGDAKNKKDCPKTHVPMKALGTRRVGCSSGAVYLFHKEGIEFVAKQDRDEVAAAGAAEV